MTRGSARPEWEAAFSHRGPQLGGHPQAPPLSLPHLLSAPQGEAGRKCK